MNTRSNSVIEKYKQHKLSICAYYQTKRLLDEMQAEQLANRQLACFGLFFLCISGLLIVLGALPIF